MSTGKKENCPQRGDYWEDGLKTIKGRGRNIGTVVQGRGPKSKNIGLKKGKKETA